MNIPEQLQRIQKELEGIQAQLFRAEVAAKESKSKYRVFTDDAEYVNSGRCGTDENYPAMPYLIGNRTGDRVPYSAAFCDESTARRVCDFLNGEG